MQLIDLTLPSAAENIALDEALLDRALLDEALLDGDSTAAAPREYLRLWEPRETLVVLGRSSQVGVEVELPACRQDGVPIVRRTSGGAAIVSGRGCLMYAVVLSYELRPELRALESAHRFVLDTLIGALRRFSPAVERRGTSDLALGNRKFSGNSVRCKRTHLLYHGTLLYDFALPMVSRYLAQPPREPDYRQGRPHEAFITNLPADAPAFAAAVAAAWNVEAESAAWPERRVAELLAEKYARDDWNFRH